MTNRWRYPRAALNADLARGLVGLVLTLGPLLLLDVHWVIAVTLGGVALLFAVFTLRMAQRAMTVVEEDQQGVRLVGPLGGAIAWAQLDHLALRYFSTRRDRTKGWMQMTLKGGGRTIRLESTLDGFDAIAERAAETAKGNGVVLSDATMNNLAALGLTPPGASDQGGGWFGAKPAGNGR